ncbi:MAG: type II toxin-antitoxin system RelE/ParE family toxin [Desulfonatronovibrio sp.]
MNLKIISLSSFEKDVKRLYKKYRQLPEDLKTLLMSLSADPRSGIALSRGLYKIRIRNRSAGTGKSSGFRVIYYYVDEQEKVYLLKIYSKNEMASISEGMLVDILIKNGLD